MPEQTASDFSPSEATASPDLERPFVTHSFQVSDNFANPVALWLCLMRPDLDASTAHDLLWKADAADLCLDRETLSSACRSMFGDPVPPEGQLHHGMDYVLTTPEPGVYVSVRLAAPAVERFGYGLPQGLWESLLDEGWGGGPVRERVRAAIVAALEPIRATLPDSRPEPDETPAMGAP